MAAYVAFYGWLCWDKWRYFLYRDFDLAIFAQALNQLLAGSLHGSIRGIAWPGDHSSLVLFLIAPLYAVARSPLTLLAFQTVVLALGAVAVNRLAARTLKAPFAGVAFAAAYLSFPALGYLNLFEFHPEAIATTALLFALERIEADRPRAALLFSALALSCREDVAFVVLGMALVGLARQPRPWRFAAALSGLAVFSLVLSFGVLRPLFNQGQAAYGDMYGGWGATPIAAARALISDPVAAMQAWFSTPGDPFDSSLKRAFHVHLLMPVLFLPLASPFASLPLLPVVGEHLWSSRTPQHTIAYQYTALMIPFVFLAAIRGMRNLVDGLRLPSVGRTVAFAAVVAASLCSTIAFGPLADVSLFRSIAPREPPRPLWADRAQRPHREMMLDRVPGSGGVVAGFEFLSRLTRRDGVHSLHHVLSGTYTYSARSYPEPGDVSALIADFGDAQSLAYLTAEGSARLRSLCARNGLRPAMAADDLVLFLRAPNDTVELVSPAFGEPREPFRTTFDGRIAYLGCDPVAGTVRAGDLLALRTFWRREPAADSAPMHAYRLQLGLFDPRGGLWYERFHDLGYGLYPPAIWPTAAPMTEPYRLTVPRELPPGHYLVAARVYSRHTWRDQVLATAVDSAGRTADGQLLLGEIEVKGAR